MWTPLGESRHYSAYHRGQEDVSEIFKLKTQHRSGIRRVKETAFSVEETSRTKTLRKELFSPSTGERPRVLDPSGQMRWGWSRWQGPVGLANYGQDSGFYSKCH